MKELFLSALLMAVSTTMFGQVNVDANGRVSIGTNPPLSNTALNVGASYFSGYRHAINVGLPAESNYSTNAAISATVSSTVNIGTGRSMGVSGFPGLYTSGYNYGILGGINSSANGAGIFGTVSHHTGVYVGGKYAGYFDGPTYCNDVITATSFITPSDIRLKENVHQLRSSATDGSTLRKVLEMNVISYQYKDREIPEAERDTISVEAARDMYSMPKNVHYGLSAQELKEIYPDLVYEGQDGFYGVNYVELVPILIRSIQELKQELDEVTEAYSSRIASNATNILSSSTGRKSIPPLHIACTAIG